MEDDYRIYATKQREHWGPIFWDFLYLTCMGFPVTLSEEHKREFKHLVTNFHVFVPCPDCREHYKRNIQNVSLQVYTKNDAMDLVLKLHNVVRMRQNKRPLTKDSIIKYHYARSTGNNYKYLMLGIILIATIYIIKSRGCK